MPPRLTVLGEPVPSCRHACRHTRRYGLSPFSSRAACTTPACASSVSRAAVKGSVVFRAGRSAFSACSRASWLPAWPLPRRWERRRSRSLIAGQWRRIRGRCQLCTENDNTLVLFTAGRRVAMETKIHAMTNWRRGWFANPRNVSLWRKPDRADHAIAMASSPVLVNVGTSFLISTRPISINVARWALSSGDNIQRFARISRNVQRKSMACRRSRWENGSVGSVTENQSPCGLARSGGEASAGEMRRRHSPG